MDEIEKKLAIIRNHMREDGCDTLHLRGSDWFSWITAGESNAVLLISETGIADIVIDQETATILSNAIEAPRITQEWRIPHMTVEITPWQEPYKTRHGRIFSDRPRHNEHRMPQHWYQSRYCLMPEEIIRYQVLGQETASAMREALDLALPSWSEHMLAGALADALMKRGIEPGLILAGGQERMRAFRHPVPTHSQLGLRTMLVTCARRGGLYANCTRMHAWSELTQEEKEKRDKVVMLEKVALDASRPGIQLGAIFDSLAHAYTAIGEKDAINAHHQGGITGYLSREVIAQSQSPCILKAGMALAWNPTLSGMKIEDTVLITPTGTQRITQDTQ